MDLHADLRLDFNADLRSDFDADFDADFGADFGADLRSDLEADFRSDFEANLRSDFEAARKVPFLVKNACVVGGSFLAGAIETLLFLSFFLSDSQNTRDYPKMLIFKGGTAISCGHIYACILEIHRNRPEMGV